MTHKRQEAPGTLELVREFVNTADFEGEEEELASPAGLARWLRARNLLEPDAEVGRRTCAAPSTCARRCARSCAPTTAGDPATDAVATLRAAAQRAGVGLEFEPDGSRREPQAGGVDGALGRLLVAVHEAQHDGTWARMKACPWDTCHWAFYDHTKNRYGGVVQHGRVREPRQGAGLPRASRALGSRSMPHVEVAGRATCTTSARARVSRCS